MSAAILYPLVIRRLRLGSGVVLFVYIAAHLVNHTLGLISLNVAEKGLRVATAVWHSAAGTALLYGAAAIHIALAFNAVYERRTLRMPAHEALRIALGFVIPLQLIAHFVGTRVAHELYSLSADYHRVVSTLLTADGHARQLALLAPGWMHGCFGLHRACNRHVCYRRFRPALWIAAMLLPALAAGGFLTMSHEIATLSSLGPLPDIDVSTSDAATRIALARIRDVLLVAYVSAVGLVFAARAVRQRLSVSPPLVVHAAGKRAVQRAVARR